jgi:hypothetical protein
MNSHDKNFDVEPYMNDINEAFAYNDEKQFLSGCYVLGEAIRSHFNGDTENALQYIKDKLQNSLTPYDQQLLRSSSDIYIRFSEAVNTFLINESGDSLTEIGILKSIEVKKIDDGMKVFAELMGPDRLNKLSVSKKDYEEPVDNILNDFIDEQMKRVEVKPIDLLKDEVKLYENATENYLSHLEASIDLELSKLNPIKLQGIIDSLINFHSKVKVYDTDNFNQVEAARNLLLAEYSLKKDQTLANPQLQANLKGQRNLSLALDKYRVINEAKNILINDNKSLDKINNFHAHLKDKNNKKLLNTSRDSAWVRFIKVTAVVTAAIFGIGVAGVFGMGAGAYIAHQNLFSKSRVQGHQFLEETKKIDKKSNRPK